MTGTVIYMAGRQYGKSRIALMLQEFRDLFTVLWLEDQPKPSDRGWQQRSWYDELRYLVSAHVPVAVECVEHEDAEQQPARVPRMGSGLYALLGFPRKMEYG